MPDGAGTHSWTADQERGAPPGASRGRIIRSSRRGQSPGETVVVAFAIMCLVTGLGFVAEPAHADDATGVKSVTATDQVIRVEGSVSAGSRVEVYALDTAEDVNAWKTDDPVSTVSAGRDGAFRADVSREADETTLYYAKYVAVVDGSVVGTYRYVDHNQIQAKNTFSYPTTLSKKGLQVQMTDDAEELGVQHAAINADLSELMQVKDKGQDKTITFHSGGRDFYFDKDAVEKQDRQIKPLSDNGTLVNLILLAYNSEDSNSAASKLIHPDADRSAGSVLGFNTKTAEGLAYYTAATEFLTQRYTRADQEHGRAVGFIVGNEVDSQWTWQNMGDKPLNEFLHYYERALRITELAAQRAYSKARVYISVDHCWMSSCGANPDDDHPTRYYQVRDVLDGLNALTKAHGDYDWHVADHPYPQDLTDPRFWQDDLATDDVETTPQITFKNIELLPAYLRRDALRYHGKPRRVILSEQGCNTPDDSSTAERLQAACYALAYYKVRFLDGIDSFILHRHVDFKTEGGLRLGLWTWDDDREDQSAPGRHKLSYDVFRDIDTKRSVKTTKFALDVIGIKSWSELVPGWDPDALAQRRLPTAATVHTRRPKNPKPVSTFDDGTDGWRASDNATAVRASNGRLEVSFDAETKLWRGTDLRLDEPIDARHSRFLGVRLAVPDKSGLGTRYAKVKAYSDRTGEIAEGRTQLTDSGELQNVTLDLSNWRGRNRISRLKVWVRGSTNTDWDGTFSIADVAAGNRLARNE